MFRSRPSRLASQENAAVDDVASGLHESQALLTLNSIGDAVLSTDLSGMVTYLNAVAERMTGWSEYAAVGRPLQEVMRIVDADSREPVRDPLALAIRCEANVGVGVNCLLIARDGRETPIEDTAAPIRDRKGRVIGAVIVFHDVGAAQALSQRMSHLAQHDVLTGLPNRLLLTDRLDRAMASARRLGNLLAVLFIDLDRFKSINDGLSHAAGDQVLQSVASRLVAGVRRSDTVCRHGGDEFVVLLPEVASAENAQRSADKLCAAIAAPHLIEGSDLYLTASAGVGVYPADGADAESLMKKADLELLQAKAQRRAARAVPGRARAGSASYRPLAGKPEDSPTARRFI
jgi:diguanylate cyclase (GGDEF)-like protein/PAS domain S-box-containing protein